MMMESSNKMKILIEKEVFHQAQHKRTSMTWSKNDKRRMKKMKRFILEKDSTNLIKKSKNKATCRTSSNARMNINRSFS